MDTIANETLHVKIKTLGVLIGHLAQIVMRYATTEEEKVAAFKSMNLAYRMAGLELVEQETSNDQ